MKTEWNTPFCVNTQQKHKWQFTSLQIKWKRSENWPNCIPTNIRSRSWEWERLTEMVDPQPFIQNPRHRLLVAGWKLAYHRYSGRCFCLKSTDFKMSGCDDSQFSLQCKRFPLSSHTHIRTRNKENWKRIE